MIGKVLEDEVSEDCLYIIFHNCPDMEDRVNSLIVVLTNLTFSKVRLALFNALKASTGSGKRILKTCRPKLIRKSSIDVSGCLQYPSKVFVGQKSRLVYVF